MEVTGISASEYSPERLDLIKATCLSVAVALGDQICNNEIVIVGGLVPALLYPGTYDPEIGAHIGTNDLDLALDFVVLNNERYEEIRDLISRAGFQPDENAEGKLTRHRWRHSIEDSTIDFLIPLAKDANPKDAGKPQDLTNDFAAIKMLGLDLALEHKLMIEFEGHDLKKRQIKRTLPVCPAHIFVLLKALAMKNRDKHKDAYDLYFVLLQAENGIASLAKSLAPFRDHEAFAQMITSLSRDFVTIESRGPKDVCEFLGEQDDDLAANVLAIVTDLLKALQA